MTAMFHLHTLILLPFDSICTKTLIIIFNQLANATMKVISKISFKIIVLLVKYWWFFQMHLLQILFLITVAKKSVLPLLLSNIVEIYSSFLDGKNHSPKVTAQLFCV